MGKGQEGYFNLPSCLLAILPLYLIKLLNALNCAPCETKMPVWLHF